MLRALYNTFGEETIGQQAKFHAIRGGTHQIFTLWQVIGQFYYPVTIVLVGIESDTVCWTVFFLQGS